MALNWTEIGMLRILNGMITCAPLDRLLAVLTRLGDGGMLWLTLAALLLLLPKTRRIGLTIVIAIVLTCLFGNLLLKNLIARPRPYQVDPTILLKIPPPWEYSFPSGHSMNGFGAALSLRLYCRKAGRIALCFAVLIAFSRLYFFVHYPTDVLCGTALGCAAAVAAKRIAEAFAARRERVTNG